MGKLSRAQAVEAKCHDCMGHYVDGMLDCQHTSCPLYTWMPYRKLEPGEEWAKYGTRRVGLVEKVAREATPGELARLKAANQKRRGNK